MIPAKFGYHRPGSVDEVIALLSEHGDEGRVVAGGHSLIPMMKLRLAAPSHLIDLQALEALKGAMGFLHPVHSGLIEQLGIGLDSRGNVAADTREFATSEPGLFAAGDCRRGQSLVVWAQWEGREAARQVDQYLVGHSRLQSRNETV